MLKFSGKFQQVNNFYLKTHRKISAGWSTISRYLHLARDTSSWWLLAIETKTKNEINERKSYVRTMVSMVSLYFSKFQII